jgi:arsenate reductase-like glutaredoxin family protein
VTYNFDPDQWYKNEFEFIKTEYESDKITEQELKSALKALEKKYEEMCDRLDGTYQISH